MVLLDMLASSLPFEYVGMRKLYSAILYDVSKYTKHSSSKVIELLRKIFGNQPRQRPNILQIEQLPGSSMPITRHTHFAIEIMSILKHWNGS